MWAQISRSSLLLHLLFFFNNPSQLRTSINDETYAVVFDAGSTGTRVHVFNFDHNLDLLPVGKAYEFFLSTSPGLSSYENEPAAAAQSLKPLLKEAEGVVPQQSRAKTPLRLGATAGLRLLQPNAAEAIIDAVRSFLKNESELSYKADLVSVLKGTDEGAYQWITINYLLESLSTKYTNTIGIVDLGGGSVQIAYAISGESATNAPNVSPGEDPYVIDKVVNGTKYHLYAHSFLDYGMKAARARSLNISGQSGNPCVTNGYRGTYKYSGVVYNVSSPKSGGTSVGRCRALTRKTLRLDAPCSHKNCSFNGVWNGGGGDGLNNLYVASFFYSTASGSGIIEADVATAVVRPKDYYKAATRACKVTSDNLKSMFPRVDERDVPFLCMDLVYQYTMLVDGFGVDPTKKITVATELEHKGSVLDASWPLGCAVELVSSLK